VLSNEPPPEEGLEWLPPLDDAGALWTGAGAVGVASGAGWAGAGVAVGASVAAGSDGATGVRVGAAAGALTGRLLCGARTGGGTTAATGKGGVELRRIGTVAPPGRTVTPDGASAWEVPLPLVARPMAKEAPNSTSTAPTMISGRRSAGPRRLPTRAQRGSMRKVLMMSGS
jgi:hypothetical protein